MEVFMKGTFKMETKQEKVNSIIQMEMCMKVTIKVEIFKGKEL